MTTNQEPVTVVVTRRVRAGREADYERWLTTLTSDAHALPGYLGATIERPGPGSEREYTSVFRFADVASLRAFEASDLRRRALRDVAELVEADATWRELTGLELWFTPPPGTPMPQPDRARMCILLVAVVFGLVLSLGQAVGLVMGTAPMPLRLFVTIAIEVVLMTYVVMPRLTRWLARWIYRRA